MMLPFMQHIAGGQGHSTTKKLNSLANQFAFTRNNNTGK
jgi:hypothetical protein